MPFQRLRRAVLAAACVSSVLLAACGGGDVVSQFQPTRVVAFGDAFADAGQRGVQYTINDGTQVNWTQRLASRLSLGLTPAATGGTSYAVGSARVNTHPDAAGNASTPTVGEQITTFLAGQSPASGDLVIVNAGIGDILSEVQALNAGTQSSAQTAANLEQAGRDMGAQVRRLVDAGASHVLVVGPYNLGRSPWAASTGQQALLQDLVTRFNDKLLVSIVDLGNKVLFVDAALYFNLVTSSPASYSFNDVSSVVCTSTDAGAGIGIGTGQVNSTLCTGGTLNPSLNSTTTLFADPVYVVPAAQERFGDYAYEKLHARF